MTVVDQIKAKLDAMEPEKRQNAIKGGIVGSAILITVAAYYLTGQDESTAPPPKAEVAVIELGDDRLEDDIRAQVEREREEMLEIDKAQDEQIEEVAATATDTNKRIAAIEEALMVFSDSSASLQLSDQPPPPPAPAQWQENPIPTGPDGQPVQPIIEYVGDIGSIKTAAPPASAGGQEAATKGKKFYLPPGFMPAKLLTGLKAKTVESAREDPEPMLLRVQAPAILPNEVRAELEGCLVVAHGYGSLAAERVESRLVSLHCMDYEGKTVINSELTGILTDKDGVKGLTGKPVSKMGANLARLMIAGMVEGAGDAYAQGANTVSVSPLGQTQQIDPAQLGQAGLGRGVARASEELTKIYVELVRQSAPVLEVGPSKDVTVVLTEGVWLEVENYEG